MKKHFSAMLWLGAIYVFGIAVCVIFSVTQKGNASRSNLYFTLAFFAIAGFLFFKSYRCLKIGQNISDALEKKAENIEQLSDGNNSLIDAFLQSDNPFGNAILDTAFNKYRDDYKETRSEIGETDVDIANYINRELMEDSISMHFLNQIPGVMTGLGILGTFLGLSVGLNSFDLTGTASDITETIKPLMDGIKVAFHTSIFGLVYSLGFGFFYKYMVSNYSDTVDEFLCIYRKYVVGITNEGNGNSIIKYQKKMCNLLETQIDELKKQNNLTEQTNNNLIDQVSLMMKDILVPEIQSMSTSLKTFADNTRTDQMAELQKIVDNFVELMNKALENSFNSMADTLEKVNEWQQKSLDEMELVLKEVDNKAVSLAEINKAIGEAANSVSEYATLVEKMQDGITSNIESLNIQADANNDIVKKQAEYLEKITNSDEKLVSSVSRILDIANEESANAIVQNKKALEEICSTAISNQNALIQSFDKMIETIDGKVAQLETLSNSISTDMLDSATKLNEATGSLSEGLEGRIKETFSLFDEQLAECTKHFAGTLQHVDSTISKTKVTYDCMSDDIADKFNDLQVKLDQYLEYADKLHHNIELKWNQLKEELPEE